ncbi:MAG: cytochrome C [Planctomycetes bacterium]|nr:cytochrome C [Planctomycetota bacterium]
MRDTPGILLGTAIVIVTLFLLQAWLDVDTSKRNLEFMPDMAYSSAREAFTESSVLPGGLTQQSPVPGTVIRGSVAFPFGDGPEEAARAGRELKNPFDAATPGIRERGADRYAVFCSHCHGDGVDPGPVALHGMVPPQSLLGERAKTIADGEMFHVITRGQGNMLPHGPQIPPDDRWKIVLHVRTLQGKGK